MVARRHVAEADDAGFTLIEILVAMVILSVAVVALITVMASLSLATEHHRGLGSTDTVVRDLGEGAKRKAIYLSQNSSYPKCPVWSDLDPQTATPPMFTFPAGYALVSTPTVEYWIPASTSDPRTGAFSADRNDCLNNYALICQGDTRPECDPGLVRLTLKVSTSIASSRGGQTTTQVLVRRGNP
jgi:prepilin-type N-terminal cleavage/methylation domain-containing protein